MTKIRMDAVEIASSIHKGDFSKLRGKSFEMCNNDDMGKKYTLNQLGMTVDKLTITVNNLAKEMRNGFKQVNERINRVEARLDYNGLQIERIEKRLDYNNLKKLPESR